VIRLTLVALIVSYAAFGQAAAGPPAFEVASIKHAEPDPKVQACVCETTGRIAYRIAPLEWIIERAYNLQAPQIAGPDWLGDERFDIDAKLPEGASAEQVPAMVRTLLAERFQLAAHIQNKEIPALVLTVAKGGPKMALATDGSVVNWHANRAGIHLRQKMSTADLAYYLSFQFQRPVVNETGLEGIFAITLDFAHETALPQPAGRRPQKVEPPPPLATAVQEQLGLRVEPGKRLVEVLVIDHIAKAPTEN
jgi:uncharacterized protein (TIGR03435 family)